VIFCQTEKEEKDGQYDGSDFKLWKVKQDGITKKQKQIIENKARSQLLNPRRPVINRLISDLKKWGKGLNQNNPQRGQQKKAKKRPDDRPSILLNTFPFYIRLPKDVFHRTLVFLRISVKLI
jgi:hypothetical protein